LVSIPILLLILLEPIPETLKKIWYRFQFDLKKYETVFLYQE